MTKRFLILALTQVFLLSGMVNAQLPPRLERCLPYPTLAQEISAMQGESEAQESESIPIVVIVSVQFAPGTHISDFVRNRIISSIQSSQFRDDSNKDWLQGVQDVGVRGTLQDLGYFKAKVTADARLLDGNERSKRYALTLRVDEGWQYRLGDVHFEPADADRPPLVFSASELRQQVHLSRGELFSASEIRSSMEEITKLYATRGYIDMVPVPVALNNDDGAVIDLIIRIDEGKQYRVGKIEFVGLGEKYQTQLNEQLRSGEPFNRTLVDEFLKLNKSVLPEGASWQDVTVTRNTKDGIVDMHFYFVSCPIMSIQTQN